MDLELEPRSVAEIRETARNMTAVALEDAYAKAVDADTPLKAKLEFIDMAAKLADLHPKAGALPVIGAGFQINIMFDGASGEPPVTVIDAPPAEVAANLPGEPPAFLKHISPSVLESCNNDLTYCP